MTVKQAAEQLGVSLALVYGLCASGRIQHERYGVGRGTIRISEEALEDYREACRAGQPCPPAAGLKHSQPA
jgi:excisionase family DNA binding protein